MKVPQDWLDELARALDPEAFTPPPQLHVPLTHRMGLAQRLDDIGASFADVQADLANGFTSDRRKGRDGEHYYCLSGTRFDVFVRSQPEMDSGLPLAVVTSVKPVRRLANQNGHASPTISFHLPYEQVTCDIADVHLAIGRLRELRRRQRKARDRASDFISRPRGGATGRSDLHARTLRHYSELLTLIDLLKQRSEMEEVVRVSGTVLDPAEVAAAADDTLMCINLDRTVDSLRPGLEVAVELGSRSWTLEVVVAEDLLLCLEPPERSVLTPGTRVRLRYQESFRLKRHSYALNRFRQEEVVGDWSALARLLCAPETLDVPRVQSTLTYFNPDLNPRQRAAVAGAVGAPHAFFVQGPPGTARPR